MNHKRYPVVTELPKDPVIGMIVEINGIVKIYLELLGVKNWATVDPEGDEFVIALQLVNKVIIYYNDNVDRGDPFWTPKFNRCTRFETYRSAVDTQEAILAENPNMVREYSAKYQPNAIVGRLVILPIFISKPQAITIVNVDIPFYNTVSNKG